MKVLVVSGNFNVDIWKELNIQSLIPVWLVACDDNGNAPKGVDSETVQMVQNYRKASTDLA